MGISTIPVFVEGDSVVILNYAFANGTNQQGSVKFRIDAVDVWGSIVSSEKFNGTSPTYWSTMGARGRWARVLSGGLKQCHHASGFICELTLHSGPWRAHDYRLVRCGAKCGLGDVLG